MFGRIATGLLAAAIAMGLPIAALASSDEDAYRAREEDVGLVAAVDDDDDDDGDTTDNTGKSGNSHTSGVNSNDGTNSRHTRVSRDRDRSRGDLTKDRTKDGPGSATRDRSRHKTNDRSRNDTR
jgi:hypothetical protein